MHLWSVALTKTGAHSVCCHGVSAMNSACHCSSYRYPVQTSFQVTVLQSFVDRLSNCSVPLVRSTQTVAVPSLAKMQRSCCFCWTLIIDYRIAFVYRVNYWLQFILAYTGVIYLIVFRIFTSPWERLQSIVMSMSVCVCVSLSARISPERHAWSWPDLLRMLPMSVARSPSSMLTISRIAYKQEGVDGSA